MTKHLTKDAGLFLQNSNIVRDSVRKLIYDIPERNFSTFKSLSYVDLTTNFR